MTGRELRAQLRMQQPCNSDASNAAGDKLTVASAAVSATGGDAELRALVTMVAENWPDREEALAVALADPADALMCFRHLAEKMGLRRAPDICTNSQSTPFATRNPTAVYRRHDPTPDHK